MNHLESAESVYQRAQAALTEADKAYSEIYRIRKSRFMVTSGISSMGIWGKYTPLLEEQQERVKELGRVRSRHARLHKKLMGMLEWNADIKQYVLRE